MKPKDEVVWRGTTEDFHRVVKRLRAEGVIPDGPIRPDPEDLAAVQREHGLFDVKDDKVTADRYRLAEARKLIRLANQYSRLAGPDTGRK